MRLVSPVACLLTIAISVLAPIDPAAQAPTPTSAGPFDSLHFPRHRPGGHRRPHPRPADRPEESRRALRRRRDRRHLEDHEQRRDLEDDLRPAARQHVRRARDFRGRHEDRLGRHRRAEQPAELVLGRRRLSLDRRRRHVDATSASTTRARSAASCSIRPIRTSRTSPPSAISGRQRRARRLQDDRRRPHVDEGAVRRHAHRRDRPRDGSARPERALRRDVSAAAEGVRLQRRRTRAARSTRRPTAAPRGRSSRTAFRPATRGASAWRSRMSKPDVLDRDDRARHRPAAPTARKTPARRGSA